MFSKINSNLFSVWIKVTVTSLYNKGMLGHTYSVNNGFKGSACRVIHTEAKWIT